MGSFGDKFRKERERRGFSLDDVSNVTKIASRMLKAIEDEHFDQLPGGVFNKGFIRAYARHLGLNDEEAVNEYLDALRQAQVDAQSSWTPAPPMQRSVPEPKSAKPGIAAKAQPPKTPTSFTKDEAEELPHLQLPKAEHIRTKPPALGSNRPKLPWGIVAAVVVLLVLGVFLWNRHSRGARAENNAGRPAPPIAVSTSSTPEATPATPAASIAAQPVKAQQTALKSTAASNVPATTSPTQTNDSDVTVRKTQATTPTTAAAKPAPTIHLVIRADENSWISVAADGETVTEETLIAPAHTTVRAAREITVKVGNAAGVSFVLNDKEIPAQGAEAEVKTITFDSAGVRPATGAPTSDQPR